jgi:hypothetical protein
MRKTPTFKTIQEEREEKERFQRGETRNKYNNPEKEKHLI